MVLRASAGSLLVHDIASSIATDVIGQVRTFGSSERFTLGDQLIRAAVSVPANIAEGCGRGTLTDFRHFLCRAGRIEQEATKVRDCATATSFGNISGHGHRSSDELVAECEAFR